jgi:hypothetical protein
MNKYPKYVVVVGNPFDGMAIHGPFDEIEDANQYGEYTNEDYWWVLELVTPED